ncbi:MAG: hypothetical protein AB7P97_21860 [Hyphomonadaceae bacterium]
MVLIGIGELLGVALWKGANGPQCAPDAAVAAVLLGQSEELSVAAPVGKSEFAEGPL